MISFRLVTLYNKWSDITIIPHYCVIEKYSLWSLSVFTVMLFTVMCVGVELLNTTNCLMHYHKVLTTVTCYKAPTYGVYTIVMS